FHVTGVQTCALPILNSPKINCGGQIIRILIPFANWWSDGYLCPGLKRFKVVSMRIWQWICTLSNVFWSWLSNREMKMYRKGLRIFSEAVFSTWILLLENMANPQC